MARLMVDGMDKLNISFAELAEMPDAIPDAMLEAAADVVMPEIKNQARTMLAGPYAKGIVIYGLKRRKPQRTSEGRVLKITFDGTITDEHHAKPTRISEIAFINEFGKRGQPGRPFIATACEQKSGEAVDAAAKVYDEYLKSKGL